jgi:hypothetical protein
MSSMLQFFLTLFLIAGQDPAEQPSRAAQLKEAREQKALSIQPPDRTPLENALVQIKDRRVIERFQEGFHGFRPILGGMVTGSGFAAGGEYERHGIRASAQTSVKGYQKYELELKAPKLGERVFADIKTTYRNYTEVAFYGIGKDSRKEDRTTYRLEDTNVIGRAGVKPHRFVTAGVQAGWLNTDLPTYLQTGVFLDIDYRDQPANPRSGGRYSAN